MTAAPSPREPPLDGEQMRAVAQVQRWHDFKAHVGAYVLINTVLVIVWAVTGGGAFWPGIPLVAWGLGLSSQHFVNSFSPISEARVRRELRRRQDE
jgi:2TM domain